MISRGNVQSYLLLKVTKMVEVTLTKMKGASLLLDGYITRGKPTQRVYNGITYHIVHYQGEHANEFAIYETKNGVYDGRAELYKDGMLKIRWEMKNGKRDGLYVQYKKGLVIKKGRWKDVGVDTVEERWVENKPGSIQMIITSFGSIVYRGGFDDKLDKSGYGVEFNPDGSPNKSGLYQHDKLVWLHQRVDSPSEMVEFSEFSQHDDSEFVEDDCVFMHPEYTGNYLYNKDSNTLQRNGTGYLIDSVTGYCVAQSEWDKGVEIESKRMPLYNGWYCRMESPPSLRIVAEMKESAASSPSLPSFLNSNPSERSSSYKQSIDELILNSALNDPNTMGVPYQERPNHLKRPTSTPFSIAQGVSSPLEMYYPPPEVFHQEQLPLFYQQPPPGIPVTQASSRQQPSPSTSSAGGVNRMLEPFTDFDPLPVPMEPIEPEKKEPESKSTVADPFVLPSVLIPNLATIETLIMPPKCFGKPTYTLVQMSDIPTLKQITIGDDSFTNVRTFSLSNLKSLQSVKIGKRCCTLSKQSPVQECVEGKLSITNCPQLKTLSIDNLSFSDYHFLDLADLPALNSLSIAAVCFKYGTYFKLKCTLSSPLIPALPQLVKIRLGNYAFQYCQQVILEDLPSLQTIILGSATLECDGRDNRKSIEMEPYSFNNTIVMKSPSEGVDSVTDLPSLNQLTGDGGNFSCVSTVELINIPLLEESAINFEEPAFEWTVYLHSQNAPGLEAYINENCSYLI